MVHASMGDRGASAFMHALSCNRVIKTLCIKDNKLSSQGFLCVLNGILRRAGPSGTSSVPRAGSSESPERVLPHSSNLRCSYTCLRPFAAATCSAPWACPSNCKHRYNV